MSRNRGSSTTVSPCGSTIDLGQWDGPSRCCHGAWDWVQLALNDRARAFYTTCGLIRLEDDADHLFLPIAQIRKLGLGEDDSPAP